METQYANYNYEKSIERVNEILDSSDASYEDKRTIPPRASLTFNNGYYVDCAALFVDMRKSKSLAEIHKKPTLAKIYKTYISELVAVLRDHSKVNEIYIEGDCVWGIYDTSLKPHIDELFFDSGKSVFTNRHPQYKIQKERLFGDNCRNWCILRHLSIHQGWPQR